MKVKAANGLVRVLKSEGTNWVSGFPQSPIWRWPDCPLTEEGLTDVMTRHERMAVAIADGYSRVSDGYRIGVCQVMGGINAAGIQNAYAGLAQAFEDNSPVLCITGGTERSVAGTSHYDITRAFEPVTKWVGNITQAHRVPEVMRRAFTYLRTGRPGPVLVQIANDMAFDEYDDEEFPYMNVKGWKTGADPHDVEVAVKALLHAKSPLLYAGQGIFYADACTELQELVELVQAPLLTTLMGKSVFPENHPLSIGVRGPAAEHYLYTSDLVFGLGTGLNKGRFSHYIPNPLGKVIIQATIDELDVNKNYICDYVLVGDAKLVLRQLIEEVKKQAGSEGVRENEELKAEIRGLNEKYLNEIMPRLTSTDVPIKPFRVYWDLMHTIDRENSIVTHDAGGPRDGMMSVWESIVPHGYLGWGNVSTLGFGLGAAMGAKLAYPERMVVNVIGDAGIGMVGMDLETAVRNKIAITTIHINNEGFYYYKQFPKKVVNMAKVAEGLGEYAERVEKPDEIIPAIKRAFKENKAGRPAYLEVICVQNRDYPSWIQP